jgi:hypothetical protein
MINRNDLETMLQNQASKAHVTPDHILSQVKDVTYFYHKTLTIAVIELQNGFMVVGTSACVDSADFNIEIGNKLAYDQALNKVWELEGYVLRNKLAGR